MLLTCISAFHSSRYVADEVALLPFWHAFWQHCNQGTCFHHHCIADPLTNHSHTEGLTLLWCLPQMLKALMPVSVFAVGCAFGTESFSVNTLVNMIVVTVGVAIASYGEINLVWIGVALQLLSVASESTRLTLVRPWATSLFNGQWYV